MSPFATLITYTGALRTLCVAMAAMHYETTLPCSRMREIQRRGNGAERKKKTSNHEIVARSNLGITPRRKCFQARRRRDGDRCERTRMVVKFTEEIRDAHVEEGP